MIRRGRRNIQKAFSRYLHVLCEKTQEDANTQIQSLCSLARKLPKVTSCFHSTRDELKRAINSQWFQQRTEDMEVDIAKEYDVQVDQSPGIVGLSAQSLSLPTSATAVPSTADTSWDCISQDLSKALAEAVDSADETHDAAQQGCRPEISAADTVTARVAVQENGYDDSVVIRPPRDKRDSHTRLFNCGEFPNGQDSSSAIKNYVSEAVEARVDMGRACNSENHVVSHRLDAIPCSPPPGISSAGSGATNYLNRRSGTSALPLILETDTLMSLGKQHNQKTWAMGQCKLPPCQSREQKVALDQPDNCNPNYRHSIACLNELTATSKPEYQQSCRNNLETNFSQLKANRKYKHDSDGQGQHHRNMPSMQIDHLMHLLSEKLCSLEESSSSIDKKLDLYEYHCRKKLEDTREQLRKRIDELVENCGKQIDATILERRKRLQILERNVEDHLTATHSMLTQSKLKLCRFKVSPSDVHSINNNFLDCLVKTKRLQRESMDFNYWLDFVPGDPLESDDCIGLLRYTEFDDVLCCPARLSQPPALEDDLATLCQPALGHSAGFDQQNAQQSPNYAFANSGIGSLKQCVHGGYRGRPLLDNRCSLPQEWPPLDQLEQFNVRDLGVDTIQLAKTASSDNSVVLLRHPPVNCSTPDTCQFTANRRNSWHPVLHSTAAPIVVRDATPLSEQLVSPAGYTPILAGDVSTITVGTIPNQVPGVQCGDPGVTYQSLGHAGSWLAANSTQLTATGHQFLVPTNNLINSPTHILSQPQSIVAQIPVASGCMQFQPTPIFPQTLNFHPSSIQRKIGVVDDCDVSRKFRKAAALNNGFNRMSMAGFVPSSLMTLDIHHPIMLDCYGDPPKHLKCIKSLCFMSYNRLLVCENGRRTGHKNILIFTLSGSFLAPLSPPNGPFVNPTGLCTMQNTACSTFSSAAQSGLTAKSSLGLRSAGNSQTIIVADGSDLKTVDPSTSQIISTFELDGSACKNGVAHQTTDELHPTAVQSPTLLHDRSLIKQSPVSTSIVMAAPTYHRQDRYGGMCATDNMIYICDRKLPSVKVFDIRSSSVVECWSDKDILNPNFAYRRNGCVYVSDSASNKVLKLDAADGRRIGELSATSTNAGGRNLFNNPSGICDDGEHLAVADLYNNRIQLFIRDSLIGSIYSPCIESPFSIAFHPMGVIAISNGRPRTVTLYFTMLS